MGNSKESTVSTDPEVIQQKRELVTRITEAYHSATDYYEARDVANTLALLTGESAQEVIARLNPRIEQLKPSNDDSLSRADLDRDTVNSFLKKAGAAKGFDSELLTLSLYFNPETRKLTQKYSKTFDNYYADFEAGNEHKNPTRETLKTDHQNLTANVKASLERFISGSHLNTIEVTDDAVRAVKNQLCDHYREASYASRTPNNLEVLRSKTFNSPQ